MAKDDQNTEQKIITAASTVFQKKGLNGARMQDIAKEAGINQALLHYYFRSKEKLFRQVFEEDLKRFMSPLAAVMSAPDMDLKSRINSIVEHYITHLMDQPNLPLFIMQELTSNPDRLVSLVQNIKADREPGDRLIMQEFVDQINEGIRSGHYRAVDPVQFIVSIIAMCVFPFVSRPMLKAVFQLSDEQFREFLHQRKQEVTNYAFSILQPS